MSIEIIPWESIYSPDRIDFALRQLLVTCVCILYCIVYNLYASPINTIDSAHNTNSAIYDNMNTKPTNWMLSFKAHLPFSQEGGASP